MHNIAFIDGQNLHLGSKQNEWKVDFVKFGIYLKEKYDVTQIYYFIGYKSGKYTDIYSRLEKAGFIIVFKEHNKNSIAQKKGNVDTDIVFEIMKNLIENTNFDTIIIISGDGDYKKLIDYLILKNKFGKILFPNKKFVSSLYKKLPAQYFENLENIKKHIIYKQK